jgi:hypothetical protein
MKGKITLSITCDESKNISCSDIKIFYPGSQEILTFELLKIHHNYWLQLVLKYGISSKSRDEGGIGKRITVGWVQKQPFSYPKSKKYKGLLKPYPVFPRFQTNKEFLYPKELSRIMSLSQFILDKCYKEENPMNNARRNRLFGSKFGKSFHVSNTSRFEYLDIFVEKDGLLNRHVDYNNDARKGYTYGASYSYLIKGTNEEGIYRVNFIMVTRRDVGAFMDELHDIENPKVNSKKINKK